MTAPLPKIRKVTVTVEYEDDGGLTTYTIERDAIGPSGKIEVTLDVHQDEVAVSDPAFTTFMPVGLESRLLVVATNAKTSMERPEAD